MTEVTVVPVDNPVTVVSIDPAIQVVNLLGPQVNVVQAEGGGMTSGQAQKIRAFSVSEIMRESEWCAPPMSCEQWANVVAPLTPAGWSGLPYQISSGGAMLNTLGAMQATTVPAAIAVSGWTVGTGDTTLTLDSQAQLDDFLPKGEGWARLVRADRSLFEWIHYTGTSGNGTGGPYQLTGVSRGKLGTTAITFASGDEIEPPRKYLGYPLLEEFSDRGVFIGRERMSHGSQLHIHMDGRIWTNATDLAQISFVLEPEANIYTASSRNSQIALQRLLRPVGIQAADMTHTASSSLLPQGMNNRPLSIDIYGTSGRTTFGYRFEHWTIEARIDRQGNTASPWYGFDSFREQRPFVSTPAWNYEDPPEGDGTRLAVRFTVSGTPAETRMVVRHWWAKYENTRRLER